MTVGDRIQHARVAAGLTQAELAKLADVSVTMVGQWEIGYREPKLGSLSKLADALEIPVSKLAGLEKSDSVPLAFPQDFIEWLDRLGYEIKIVPKSNQ